VAAAAAAAVAAAAARRSDRRGFVFALSFQEEVEVAFSLIRQLLTPQQHGRALICQG
jgi:hypothetical protein